MNKKGFTLSEMLVVIAIIAVLAVIAIPSVIAINNNINKRLKNEKITQIQASGELFGSDNPDIFNGKEEVRVYVSELIDSGYLKPEVKYSKDSSDCNDSNSNGSKVGCIMDPTENKSMNFEYVILRKGTIGIISQFNGSESQQDELGTLVDIVCGRLDNGTFKGKGIDVNTGKEINCNCDTIEAKTVNACLITGSDVNNYLRYDGVYWRVMGIYNIYGDTKKLSAKMINDDNVELIID